MPGIASLSGKTCAEWSRSQRVIVSVDSGVVKGAVRKFRSSSRRLNSVLRRRAALCLAANVNVEVLWIPTWANPSDTPSRDYDLDIWLQKLRVIQPAVLERLKASPELALQASIMQNSINNKIIYIYIYIYICGSATGGV